MGKFESLRRALAGGFGAFVGLFLAKYFNWTVIWSMLTSGMVAFVFYDAKGFVMTIAGAVKSAVEHVQSEIGGDNLFYNNVRYSARNVNKFVFMFYIYLFVLEKVITEGYYISLEVLVFFVISTCVFVYWLVGILYLKLLSPSNRDFHEELRLKPSSTVIKFYFVWVYRSLIMLILAVMLLPLWGNLFVRKMQSIEYRKKIEGIKFVCRVIGESVMIFVRKIAKLFVEIGRLSSFIFAVIGYAVGAIMNYNPVVGFIVGLVSGLIIYESLFYIVKKDSEE
jgi:hypothetical protein